MESNFIQINNIKIHYLEKCVNKNLPTIVAVHGAGECCEIYSSLVEKLNNYNLILLDLCGHGKSQGDAKNSLNEYLELVDEFINKINYDNIILMGHSLGSILSVLMGIKGNDKIKKIVLLASTPKIEMPSNIDELVGNYDAFKSMVMSTVNIKDTNYVNDKFNELFNCSDENRKKDFKCVGNIDLINQLYKIDVPVLIVCGDRDLFMTLDMQVVFKKEIKDSQLYILPNRGHAFIMEPSIIDMLCETIKGFIN